MRYLWLFLVLACAPPAYAASIYESIYKCEGGREGSSEGFAAYRGFLCTKEFKVMQSDQYVATNSDARNTDLLTIQLVGIEGRMEQLRGSANFSDRMTQKQLTKERDSLTQQLQAYREIDTEAQRAEEPYLRPDRVLGAPFN